MERRLPTGAGVCSIGMYAGEGAGGVRPKLRFVASERIGESALRLTYAPA